MGETIIIKKTIRTGPFGLRSTTIYTPCYVENAVKAVGDSGAEKVQVGVNFRNQDWRGKNASHQETEFSQRMVVNGKEIALDQGWQSSTHSLKLANGDELTICDFSSHGLSGLDNGSYITTERKWTGLLGLLFGKKVVEQGIQVPALTSKR